MQKGQIFIWVIVGALVIAVAGGAYYLGRSSTPKSSPAPVVTSPASPAKRGEQTPKPTPIPSPTQDETANWKTFTDTNIGFSFMYPKSLENYGAIAVNESDGEKGKLFGGGFSKDNSYPTVFSFGGTTTDFAVGREEFATIGFEKSDKRIFYKFYTNSLDITDSVIKTFFNNNGVEVVIFNRSALHPAFQGEIGAVINLKNATYPGIGFRIDPTRLDIATFEKILSTFRFD